MIKDLFSRSIVKILMVRILWDYDFRTINRLEVKNYILSEVQKFIRLEVQKIRRVSD